LETSFALFTINKGKKLREKLKSLELRNGTDLPNVLGEKGQRSQEGEVT